MHKLMQQYGFGIRDLRWIYLIHRQASSFNLSLQQHNLKEKLWPDDMVVWIYKLVRDTKTRLSITFYYFLISFCRHGLYASCITLYVLCCIVLQ